MLTCGSVRPSRPPRAACRRLGLALEDEDRAEALAVGAQRALLVAERRRAARCLRGRPASVVRRGERGSRAASGRRRRPSTCVGLPCASTPVGGSSSVTFAPAGGVVSSFGGRDRAVGDVGRLELEHRRPACPGRRSRRAAARRGRRPRRARPRRAARRRPSGRSARCSSAGRRSCVGCAPESVHASPSLARPCLDAGQRRRLALGRRRLVVLRGARR